jgi:hypothetical protein
VCKLKKPDILWFVLLFVLLPCVLFSVLGEFARDTQEMKFHPSSVLGGNTSESGETGLLVSESLLLYSCPLIQNRSQLSKLWRQFLSLVFFALILKAFSKITLRKYCLHHYCPLQFLHIFMISLLLGGRAPPSSAY